ncbi:hypothetical protein QQS21_008572 [Conoideocrella luteorostrata]|uniref:Uncharacterized protein n=1 Tax=Conoideocrella luteorostrata TaxID=1105319 RepID=A0AAJ0CLC3_9HYPO|nr:hypothetical protein QQS21_008572 [Conoideocrella luteorostrata]
MPSSPPANPFLSPTRTSCRKEKRNPSITPRRFGRFFTPRSTLPPENRVALGILHASATNRQLISPQSLAGDPLSSDPICPSSPTEGLGQVDGTADKRKRMERTQPSIKRRRGLVADDMAPPPLRLPGRSIHMTRDGDVHMTESPSESDAADGLDNRRRATLSHFFKASRGSSTVGLEEKSFPAAPSVQPSELRSNLILEGYRPKPIRKFRNRGFEAQLLDREQGFASHTGRQYLNYPAHDARTHSASFYSRSCDVHQCTSYTGQGNTIPFSLSSCHRAPVTAIGDEQGFVRLFNTKTTDGPVDSKVDVHIQVHDNAIMDLDFSDDDMRLATACGDRTGKIVDVPTQSVAVELAGGHWDSLRQVAFQPGKANGSVLATSDRAGRVQIWDLRCSPMVTGCFTTAGLFGTGNRDVTIDPVPAKTVNTIDNAHVRTVQGVTSSVSITAMQWLPSGREHLLLTASEANACIKLWDTRYIKPRRQVEETPLAMTPQPLTHAWRSYGITSLALSTDASRLYAVCKDSTVYAYSTAHLLLGHAPELQDGASKRKPSGNEGLGPLYGFKHDSFRVSSFYVKCAIRPSSPTSNDQPELLAVGSTDSCAMVFPTDEQYMRSAWAKQAHAAHDLEPGSSQSAVTPSQSFSSSAAATPSGLTPSSSPVPMFRSGTPLVRGHSREVTTLSWSHDGKLVTASDDYVVRQWQSGGDKARYLRQVGEFGGERHMAGWAEVGHDWDLDDDEDDC